MIVIYVKKKRTAFRIIPFLKEKTLHEAEFQDHCKNFQNWAKNEYDPDLLDPFIAFPLLRWLFRAGIYI